MTVSKAQLKANDKYDKANTRRVGIKLNINTDKDILDWLDTVGNKQGYIKDLIRSDMKKQGCD